jgi:hypothetical protein
MKQNSINNLLGESASNAIGAFGNYLSNLFDIYRNPENHYVPEEQRK